MSSKHWVFSGDYLYGWATAPDVLEARMRALMRDGCDQIDWWRHTKTGHVRLVHSISIQRTYPSGVIEKGEVGTVGPDEMSTKASATHPLMSFLAEWVPIYRRSAWERLLGV